MKEFILAVVKALVDSPDEVQLTESFSDGRAVYELRVAPSDLGKVIGKGGQTARSLRTLMSAIAAKHGKRVGLEILD
ncbi:MAG TPA: KH domain-containing protein [candidate division Zixibacteria bacterium]|nr:KH domain-containing protein [candidate division Zixibacteria bacterium]